MKALVLKQAGGTPAVDDFKEPEAKEDGQAVVKVLAASLNPYDRAAAQSPEPLPRVVGLEAVVQLADGSRVYSDQSVAPFGMVAEQALIKSASVTPLPENLTNGLALAMGVSGMAAWLPLSWKTKLQAGESVLILGATGVQGQIAVQSAKLLGAGHVVAAGRNREILEELKQHGADEIAVLEGDLAKVLKDAAPKGGYHVVIDSLFGKPLAGLLDSGTLGADSRVAAVGGSAGQEIKLGFRQLQANKGATIAGYSTFFVPADVKREAHQTLIKYVADGKIKVDVKSFPLAEAAEAWEAQASGPHQKIIIEP